MIHSCVNEVKHMYILTSMNEPIYSIIPTMNFLNSVIVIWNYKS